MPHYLAIGVSWERFMDSCPKELEPYDTAHRKKIEEQDYLQYLWWGNYGMCAMGVAVEHCLNGKKAKSKFLDKPVMQRIEEQNKSMSEDDLQRKRELFVAKLEVMKTNFELNHEDSTVS